MDVEKLSEMIRDDPHEKELYYERGLLFYKNGAYRECICDMMAYHSLQGTSIETLLYIGRSIKTFNPHISIKYFEDYLNRAPEDVVAREEFAMVLNSIGDHNRSSIELDKITSTMVPAEMDDPNGLTSERENVITHNTEPSSAVTKKRSLFRGRL